MTTRFTAQRSTVLKELYKVMQEINATSLKINEPDLLDPDDNAAEIIFERNGVRYISRCATYNNFRDNLRAAQLAISYTHRIIEVYGVEQDESTLDEKLKTIFGWLEAPLSSDILMLGDGDAHWTSVLSLDLDASNQAIENRFKVLAKVHHPDAGGDKEDWLRLKKAYDQARGAV